VERIPLQELTHRIMAGEIEDGKTIAGVLKAKLLLGL
jgi:ADP-ribose pyrophosphatase